MVAAYHEISLSNSTNLLLVISGRLLLNLDKHSGRGEKQAKFHTAIRISYYFNAGETEPHLDDSHGTTSQSLAHGDARRRERL